MAEIFLGTSSWSFDAWRGVFYPEKSSSSDFLAYYARRFRTVEVNTSFYGLPAPETLVRWVETVPPGFSFALKFPRQISHEKRLAQSDAETLAFLDVLAALGPAAGPALLQLPPDFTRQRYGRVLASYLDWLAPLTTKVRVAVEVRAADLMTEAFAAFLAERGFALALVDRVDTPDLYELWAAVRGAVDFSFIRWIGDDRNGPKGDREITAPRDDALALWAARLVALQSQGCDSFGYMHNPYEGHAPASVARLEALLAGQGVLSPWPPAGEGDDTDGSAAQMRLL